MEQHPIPQNVTTFQFRLIGDMTFKQFGYLLGGGIVAIICWNLPLPIIFTLPLTVIAAMLGIGLAFVPIEERPMDVWIVSFIKSIYSPTLYVWQREKPLPAPVESVSKPVDKPQKTVPQPSVLVNLPAQTTPPVASPTVVPASGHLPNTPKPDAEVTQSPPPEAPAITQAKTAKPEPATGKTAKPNIASFFAPKKSPGAAVPQITKPQPTTSKPASPRPALWMMIMGLFQSKPKQPPSSTLPKPTGKPVTTTLPPAIAVPTVKPKQPNRPGFLTALFSAFGIRKKPAPAEKPVTGAKDMFSDLKTPTVTGTTLNVPGFNAPAPANQPTPPKEEPKPDENQPNPLTPGEITAKNQALEQKLTNLEQELSTKNISESRVVELQQQLTDVLSERQKMEAELQILRNKLSQMQETPTAPPTQFAQPKVAEPSRGPTVKVITAETAVKAGLPQLTTFPNVVTGIIKDYNNNLLPGVLVTVRDTEGVPLRALKTNRLGQFAASTPLPNGVYLIEVEDPKNSFIFDRIQITLNGNVAPAVEVVAKSQKQIEREKLEKAIFGGTT
jgi:hypothetical protein